MTTTTTSLRPDVAAEAGRYPGTSVGAVAPSALILCPPGRDSTRILLGLSVGERCLLALAHAGVRRVAFLGPGEPPCCERAAVAIVHPSALLDASSVVLIAADTVFDPRLVSGELAVAPSRSLNDLKSFNDLEAFRAGRGVTGSDVADLPLRWLDRVALRMAIADPDGTLAALPPGRAGSGHGYAIRVTGDASAETARRALLASLRKPVDGFVSRHFNRYISGAITPLLARTGLPPNLFTVLFLVVGLLAAWMAASGGSPWELVAAGLLFQAQSILDGCDGELARLTYRFSRIGQWLDTVSDGITNYAFCFGLAVGLTRSGAPEWVLPLAAVSLTAQCLASGVLFRRLILSGTGDLLSVPDLITGRAGGGGWSALGKLLRLLSRRDTFIAIVAALTVAQLPFAAFLVYSAGTFPTLIGVVLNDLRIARGVGAALLGRAGFGGAP